MASAEPYRSATLSAALRGRRIGLLTAFAGPSGGGVAEAVAAQARIIAELGAEPVVFALAEPGVPADRQRLCQAEHILSPILGPRQIGFAPAQPRRLEEARLDLLHLHGIWMHPSRDGLRWAAATGRPYVISPHGMLDPWIVARGRWKKALARRGYERAGWARATALHALTQAEAGDIARESGRDDAIVIPNPGPAAITGLVAERPPELLYIGRIHPKKNLQGLLDGWRAAKRPPEARLRIAGWGAEQDVAALRRDLHDRPDPTIEFLGPVFGEAKQRLLQTARFAVLPSFSEGLPMAMLEAWAAGVPTLISAHCNLADGFEHGAALPCGTSPGDIASAIAAAFALDCQGWRTMAESALALAAGPFSAATVASRWEELYASLLERSA